MEIRINTAEKAQLTYTLDAIEVSRSPNGFVLTGDVHRGLPVSLHLTQFEAEELADAIANWYDDGTGKRIDRIEPERKAI